MTGYRTHPFEGIAVKREHANIGARSGVLLIIAICKIRFPGCVQSLRGYELRCDCGKTRKLVTRNFWHKSHKKCACKQSEAQKGHRWNGTIKSDMRRAHAEILEEHAGVLRHRELRKEQATLNKSIAEVWDET